MSRRRRAVFWTCGALLSAVSVNCGADSDEALPAGVGASGSFWPGEERDSTTVIADPGAGGTSNGEQLHPACGVGSCVPDDPTACEPLDGGMGGMGGLGLGGTGLGGDIGFGGSLPSDPGKLGDEEAACHVVWADECEGDDCQPARVCSHGGFAEVGEPCLAQEDCRSGTTCVGDGDAGVCRNYCCRGSEASCDANSYCDERPVVGEAGLQAPVCVPLDGCSLSEPFPCLDDQECTCDADEACIVVRSDGSTSCTEPGDGRQGDACSGTVTGECAYGFVCSPGQGCIQLCSIFEEMVDCPAGATCQRPPDFPDHLGVCAGAGAGSGAAQ